MQHSSAFWLLLSLLAVVYAQGPQVPVCAQPCVQTSATTFGCTPNDFTCLCGFSGFVSTTLQCAATVCAPEDRALGQRALEDACDVVTGTGTSTGTGTFTGTLSSPSTFPPLSSGTGSFSTTSTGITTTEASITDTTISTTTPVIPPTTQTTTQTTQAPPVTQTTGTTPPPLPTQTSSPRPTSGLGQTTQGQPTGQSGSQGGNGNNGAARYTVAGAGYLVGMGVMMLML